ncbi:ribosomal L7Ae/L30e/S12e/Gadd45 family protein [Sporolactobacillus sp. CQH2019]|uniref:L7Ae/L30e/S12e/Gadd45 family ribosomal protein n=1 Tax=Sporolactobacillus sp. CQH2019 TaxID=3023512 RepID=UPI002368108D|nr:ribosomal L7Ae/L30e/S12e/Gadd45 family protein [Sporolactobacillus sp. CQH2019]MDD9147025.1 ribosomal L7Ae/L30e/S12e/Gadd45 family protein [Sporolactobacillus sp. CQH2019]
MPEKNDPWYALLGLAKRAGKVVAGEETVLKAIRGHKAGVVIMSSDASDRTKKTVNNKCIFYKVPIFETSERVTLGRAIGQPPRVLIAVTDSRFAARLIEWLGPSTRG